MDEKIKILLDKINLKEDVMSSFSCCTLEKIIVNKKENTWTIIIKTDSLLPKDIVETLEENKNSIDPSVKNITIKYNIENPDLNTLISYYPLILKDLKDDLINNPHIKNKIAFKNNKFI